MGEVCEVDKKNICFGKEILERKFGKEILERKF